MQVRHTAYSQVKPDKVVKWAGGPIAIVDCFGILNDIAGNKEGTGLAVLESAETYIPHPDSTSLDPTCATSPESNLAALADKADQYGRIKSSGARIAQREFSNSPPPL
jgi:hypothetical protein